MFASRVDLFCDEDLRFLRKTSIFSRTFSTDIGQSKDGPDILDHLGSGAIADVFRNAQSDDPATVLKVFRKESIVELRSQVDGLGKFLLNLQRLRLLKRHNLILLDAILSAIYAQSDVKSEAKASAEFSMNFEGQRYVRCPQVCWANDSAICVEEISPFIAIHDVVRPEEQRFLVRLLLRSVYQMIFTDGLIHGDLHPGNYGFDGNSKLAIVDFGLCWRLGSSARVSFAHFFLSFTEKDGVACAAIAEEFAIFVGESYCRKKFSRATQELLDQFGTSSVGEFSVVNFCRQFFDVQQKNSILSGIEFIAPISALASIEGILNEFYPELDFIGESRSFVLNAMAGVQRRQASDNILYDPFGA